MILIESDLSNPKEDLKIYANRLNINTVVLTNGCFDILTRTHVRYLEWCKRQGDILIVAVNSDDSVKQLKGSDRPINNLVDRLYVLDSLKCVDFVMPFNGLRCTSIIKCVKPDVYVKGGDYNLDKLNEDEKNALLEIGSIIKFAPNPEPITTSNIIDKMRNLNTTNII